MTCSSLFQGSSAFSASRKECSALPFNSVGGRPDARARARARSSFCNEKREQPKFVDVTVLGISSNLQGDSTIILPSADFCQMPTKIYKRFGSNHVRVIKDILKYLPF